MSLIVTGNQVQERARAARQARGIIAEAVVASRITGRPSGVEAWGQFLDRPDGDKHVGVFGSSAAIILSKNSTQIDDGVVAGAVRALPAIGVEATDTTLHRQRDLAMTIKLALAALALRAGAAAENDCRRLEALLRARNLGGNGWGYYWVSPQRHDPVPRIVPTAFALDALKEDRYFIQSDQLVTVTRWLVTAAVSTGARLVEKLVALKALYSFESIRGLPPDVRGAMGGLLDEIVAWSLVRPSDVIGRAETVHYRYETANDRDCHDYMIFPVDVLALDVLARGKALHRSPTYATRVVDFISSNVEANAGYRSPDSGRRAMMDQLYVFDALSSFVDELARNPRVLMSAIAARLAESPTFFWVALLITMALGALAAAGAVFANLVLLKALLGVVSGFLASVAAALAFARWLDLRRA